MLLEEKILYATQILEIDSNDQEKGFGSYRILDHVRTFHPRSSCPQRNTYLGSKLRNVENSNRKRLFWWFVKVFRREIEVVGQDSDFPLRDAFVSVYWPPNATFHRRKTKSANFRFETALCPYSGALTREQRNVWITRHKKSEWTPKQTVRRFAHC